MAIQFYDGKPVLCECDTELYMFECAVFSMDDCMGEEHFVRRHERLSKAWRALLDELRILEEEQMLSGDIGDSVMLFFADD